LGRKNAKRAQKNEVGQSGLNAGRAELEAVEVWLVTREVICLKTERRLGKRKRG